MIIWLAIILSGILGAIISKATKVGKLHWSSIIFASTLSGGTWAWMVKSSNSSLLTNGAMFDVVYSLGYFVTFVIMGEKASITQMIGIGLATFSLWLMNK